MTGRHLDGDTGIDTAALAAAIRGRMKHDGISGRAAASQAGVSFSTISRASRALGVVDVPSYVALCRWLRLSLDTFVPDTDP